MENSHKTRDQLLARSKQLEADMKTLRREFNKKTTETHNNRAPQSQDMSEEIERLRREIQRYRLELSNRDNNFNRMFNEKQPMLVNQKHQKQAYMGAIYAFSQGSNGPSKNSLTNGQVGTTNGYTPEMSHTELTAPCHPTPRTPMTQNNQSILRGREQVHQINFLEPDNQMGQLERQQSVHERSSIQDRVFTNSSGRHKTIDKRPRTQQFGQKMRHDRLFSLERSTLRQTSSALYPEQPTQILPQVRHYSLVRHKRRFSSITLLLEKKKHKQTNKKKTNKNALN